MNLTVAIATSGRREVLKSVLAALARQTRSPDMVVVCPASPGDLDEAHLRAQGFPASVVRPHQAGLPAQRNAILRSAAASDVLLFLDDDFLPRADYLAECEAVFSRDRGVVMLTGQVIADGAQGAGIALEEAQRLLAADAAETGSGLEPVYNAYGCNMALRLEVARANAVEFDERLPLYGWLEDVDFSRRMAPYGSIVKASACRGVHMGTKKGRTSGRRLGYSQIANPLYLWRRKKTLTLPRALAQMSRNVLANLGKALRPEPWVDRRGRLAGNVLAVGHALTGRLDPQNISRF